MSALYDENTRKIKKWSIFFFILALTMFSIFILPGYDLLEGDQRIYVPAIKQELNPELYPNDHLLSFKQTNFTLFDEIVVFLVDNFNIDLFVLFFILFFLFRFICFYSIFKLSFYFTKSKLFSIFSTLLFLNPFYTYAMLSRAFVLETHPRSISLALNLLFLAFYFNRKRMLSTTPLGLGLIIHPITSLPFIVFYYLHTFFFSVKKKFINLNLKSVLLGLIPFVWLFVLLLSAKSSSMNLFGILDPLWESIIRFRDGYAFISNWSILSIPFHILTFSLLIISLMELKNLVTNKIKKKQLYLLIGIPTSLTILSFLFSDILKFHFVTELQIARSLIVLHLFTVILFSFYGINHIRKNPKDYLYNLSIIGLLCSFIIMEAVSLAFFPLFIFIYLKRRFSKFTKQTRFINNKLLEYSILTVGISVVIISSLLFSTDLEKKILTYITAILVLSFFFLVFNSLNYCKINNKRLMYGSVAIIFFSLFFLPQLSIQPSFSRDNQFLQACEWIEENTNNKDVFLTEPFTETDTSSEIRSGCGSNVYFSQKDGAQVIFDRKYALEWYKRYKQVELIKNSPEEVIQLANKERIDYLISVKYINLTIPLLFNNSKYYIYSIENEIS